MADGVPLKSDDDDTVADADFWGESVVMTVVEDSTDAVGHALADPDVVAAADTDGAALPVVSLLLESVPQLLEDADGDTEGASLDEPHADVVEVALADLRGEADTLCDGARDGVFDVVCEMSALALPLVDAPTDRVGVRELKIDGDADADAHVDGESVLVVDIERGAEGEGVTEADLVTDAVVQGLGLGDEVPDTALVGELRSVELALKLRDVDTLPDVLLLVHAVADNVGSSDADAEAVADLSADTLSGRVTDGEGVTVGGCHVCDPVAETVSDAPGVTDAAAGVPLVHADVSGDDEKDTLPDVDEEAAGVNETHADALGDPLTRGDADGDVDPLTELLTGGDRVGDEERSGDELSVTV